VADFELLEDQHRARLAVAEQNVSEWRWSREVVSLARWLVPVWEERQGDRRKPVRFLRHAPKRLLRQSVFGFDAAGRITVERFHAYGRLSTEEFVGYNENEVEAVRYEHWVVGDPAAGQIAVVPAWHWRLVYDGGRPLHYEFAGSDGAWAAEEYGYGADGTLTTVVGNRRSRFGDEAWSLFVRETVDGGVVEVTDKSGERIYSA
jgi:hypothetical protein